jgi:CubicO group peptidase (beta-lactamase class C family)
MSVATLDHTTVDGHVGRGFEAVRAAFAGNFIRRRELGGACCAYHNGERVVDLWGGIRNKQTGAPWERDTMVVVHSASKGLAAMTLAVAHSRGWLDYEERICAYWPEFAQQGKERITVRQLLAHQAGLFAIEEPVDRSILTDLDQLAVILARQTPAVLMVWVYEHTASVLVAMLMHASFTASLLILTPVGLSGAHLVIYSFALAAALWVGVAAVSIARFAVRYRRTTRRIVHGVTG